MPFAVLEKKKEEKDFFRAIQKKRKVKRSGALAGKRVLTASERSTSFSADLGEGRADTHSLEGGIIVRITAGGITSIASDIPRGRKGCALCIR